MRLFPTLYKKTSTGAIQYWSIEVEPICSCDLPYIIKGLGHGPVGSHSDLDNQYAAGVIRTDYGQLGTNNPQVTRDLIKEGKNAGKKNETTAFQQAVSEAQSKWEQQKKKGYVENKKDAEAGKVDKIIEGGVSPMLAHKFSEQGHKIRYPAYIQPKLDGIRCIAIYEDQKVTLWSRTRKRITSMPHIVKAIEDLFYPSPSRIVLDGELYNHEFKSDFEKIVSAVRKESPEEGYLNVQYHIYDMVSGEPFSARNYILNDIFLRNSLPTSSPLKRVETRSVDDESGAAEWFDTFRSQGYEGAIIRNASGLYANKRSYDLQKLKEFDDEEFKILGIEEGRGKLSGHVGAFICETSGGRSFLAKAKGPLETLRTYFNNHETWKGKKLTVQYQGLTGKNGVPRFPVGVAIRDYE